MIPVDKEPEDRPMSDELYDLCVIRAVIDHAEHELCKLERTHADAGRTDIAAECGAARRSITHAGEHLDEAYAKQKESEE